MTPKYPLQKYVDLIELSGLQDIFNETLDNTVDAEIAFKDEDWLTMESEFKKQGRIPIFPADYPPFKYGLANRISITLNIIYKDAIELFNENVNSIIDGQQRENYVNSLLRKVADLSATVLNNHIGVYGAPLIQESLARVNKYYSKHVTAEDCITPVTEDLALKGLKNILRILHSKGESGVPYLENGQIDIVLTELRYIIENKRLPVLKPVKRFKIEISNIEFVSYLFHEVLISFSKDLPTGELGKLLPEYLIKRFDNFAGMQAITIKKKWSPGTKKDAYDRWKQKHSGEKGE